MPQLAVVARQLELRYGPRVALAASDFDIPASAVTSIIGPNGSGKSSMLHAFGGLLRPAGGTLEVFGTSAAAASSRVAYVLQATAVNEALPVTVREVVAMGRYAARGLLRRLTKEDYAAVDMALDRLKLGDLQRRHLRELSGGERQRVFVAQGLVERADLLLLDEPLTGLDIPSHERIDEVIAEERAAGTTVVLTTHEIGEAARTDHVLLLGGRVVASGAPEAVLTAHLLATAYGSELLHFATDAIVLDDPHHARGDS